MYLLLTLIALSNANPFQKETKLNIYNVDINLYNNYNCSKPYDTFNYSFSCDTKINSTDCCLADFNKHNITFGNQRCIQFENNNTYMSYKCLFNKTMVENETDKLFTGLVSGGIIIGLCVIVTFIIWITVKQTRRKYNPV